MPKKKPTSYTPKKGVFARVTFPSRYAYRRAHQYRKGEVQRGADEVYEYLSNFVPSELIQEPRVKAPAPRRYNYYPNARIQTTHYAVQNRGEYNALINQFEARERRAMIQPRIKINGSWRSGYRMAYADEVDGEVQRLLSTYGIRIQDVDELELVEMESADDL